VKSLAGFVLGSGLLFLSGTALADGKFYLGLDVGRSKLDATVSQQFFGSRVGRESGNDTGYKLRVGYQFIRYVALEAGYADFGEISIHDIPYNCIPPATGCRFDVRSKTNGAFANVVGSWPFADGWALNGRLGAMRARVSTTEENPVVASTRRHYSDINTAVAYGAGLSYSLSSHTTLSLDWAQFDQVDLGLTLGGSAGVYDLGSSSLTSLGISYRF
jgi:OOP family OmpA-OmpF porin